MNTELELNRYHVDLKPYVLRYALVLIGLTVIVWLFGVFVFELPRGGTNIAIVMGAAGAAASKFTGDHRRLIVRGEKYRLAAYCLATNIVLGIVAVATVLAIINVPGTISYLLQIAGSIGHGFFAAVMLILLVAYYFSHVLALGIFNKAMLKGLNKRQEQTAPCHPQLTERQAIVTTSRLCADKLSSRPGGSTLWTSCCPMNRNC